MFASHVEHRVKSRMSRSTGGIQFHGDTGLKDLPALSQGGARLLQIVALTGHGQQKPLGTIEGALRCRESIVGQLRRQDSVACGQSGMEWLAHGAKIFFES